MCASSAIAFDSGLIDVNDAFGLNLQDTDRLRFRRRDVCAIVPTEGHTRIASDLLYGRPQSSAKGYLEYLYDKGDEVG